MKHSLICLLICFMGLVKFSAQVAPGPFYAGCEQCTNTDFYDIKDTTTTAFYYNMDLDSNGVDDLKFLCINDPHHGFARYLTLVYMLNNSMISYPLNDPGLVMRHDSLDIISDQLNWNSTADTLHYYFIVFPPNASSSSRGLWNSGSKYMAVRLDGTDSVRYAWIKLSVPSLGQLTVYNYGIQKKLPAVGIKENVPGSLRISLYPNPAREYTMIQCHDFNNDNYKLEVLNMKGQAIFFDKIIDGNYKLNTSEMAKGIYAVRIIKDDGNAKVVKLIVQ